MPSQERGRSIKPVRAPKNFEGHELVALVRLFQFLFQEGVHSGFNQGKNDLNDESKSPESPTHVGFDYGPEFYSKYVTGEVTKVELDNLIKFFKVEVAGNLWGRILFYLIQGGTEIRLRGRPAYISRLPRLFFPARCLVPHCSGQLPMVKGTPVQRLLCTECDSQQYWQRSREVMKTALMCAYQLT